MRENFDHKVKKRFPLKNGNIILSLEDDEDVDDFDEAKSVYTRPSPFGRIILSHSKRLMNDVIKQIDGFENKSMQYTDTDSLYIHKKYWSSLDDNGFIDKSIGLGKNYYGNSDTIYAWFLAPKIKHSLVIDDFGVFWGQ